jgi:hypothetical protein
MKLLICIAVVSFLFMFWNLLELVLTPSAIIFPCNAWDDQKGYVAVWIIATRCKDDTYQAKWWSSQYPTQARINGYVDVEKKNYFPKTHFGDALEGDGGMKMRKFRCGNKEGMK